MSKNDSDDMKDYFQQLISLYRNVIERTITSSRGKTRMLLENLINWMEALTLFKKYPPKVIVHTISGIIFMHLLRLNNWIIFEILSGHYFEALRDLRFLFEGSLLAWHYDRFIDNKFHEKWGISSIIPLKMEIIELKEKAEKKVRELKQKDENSSEDIKRSIKKDVDKYIEQSKRLSEEGKLLCKELYLEILSQPELYWSIPNIINEFTEGKSKKIKKILHNTWTELSHYAHFSSKFFELALEEPMEIWVEYYDKRLFEKCCDLFLTTNDLFISVLAISFPAIREELKEKIVDWWEKNLGIKLKIAKTILEFQGSSSV